MDNSFEAPILTVFKYMSYLTDTAGKKLSADQEILILKEKISLKSVLFCGKLCYNHLS